MQSDASLSHPQLADHEPRGRLPILSVATFSLLVAAWSIFVTNLTGSDSRNIPLILSGILIAFIAFFDIRVGLAALLLAIGLSPEFEVYGIQNFRYEDLLIPLLLLIWVSNFVLKRQELRTTDLKTPILIIVFLSLISSLSNHLYQGLDLQGSMLRFGKNVSYYLIMFIVLNSLRSKKDIRSFMILMLVSSAFVGIYGLIQYSFGVGGANYRLPGPPGETANILGGYFVFHMCLALGLQSRSKSTSNLLLLCYLGLMIFPFIMTLSRTSYVALAVGLAVIWIVGRNQSFGWALVVMGASLLFAPQFVYDRLLTILDVVLGGGNASWDSRVAGWSILVPSALKSPLLGRGIGSKDLGQVDSEYVLQLNDLGIIGLVAFLVLVGRCIRTSTRLIKEPEGDRTMQGFALGYLGGCVGLLVHSLAATTFTTIRTTEPFFFATGLIYAYWNISQRARKHRHHAGSRELPDSRSQLPPLYNLPNVKSLTQESGPSDPAGPVTATDEPKSEERNGAKRVTRSRKSGPYVAIDREQLRENMAKKQSKPTFSPPPPDRVY